MIIHPKNAVKLVGILVMAICAAFVCTLFLNFNTDLAKVQDEITNPLIADFYDIMVNSGKVTSAVSGGALVLTSVVMLLFYIKHYIDTHREELGILKALGYSRIKIAKSFWVFGLSMLVGCGIGFAGAFIMMPAFYKQQLEEAPLQGVNVSFTPMIFVFIVLVPAAVFALLAVIYALGKLKQPALALIRGAAKEDKPAKIRKIKQQKNCNLPFLKELQKSTVRSRFSLVFLIWFSAFCFASMGQMAMSMSELSSEMMGAMMLVIGMVLAFLTLFIALTTVGAANAKTIAMLRVFGYSKGQCAKAILSGYRPVAYFGFLVGTLYQFGLLKIMVNMFFTGQTVVDIPEYNFDFVALAIVLPLFIVIYELIMQLYSIKINRTPLKEVMMGE